MNKKWFKPLLSGSCWLVLVLLHWPASPLNLDYVRLILIAAPLFIVPLCEEMEGRSFWTSFSWGLSFAFGMLLAPGWTGFLLVLPWWVFSAWRTVTAFTPVVTKLLALTFSKADLLDWTKLMASPLFLLIAASWAIADRLELALMGFDATITLLTAVHFHYAGFTLSWLLTRIPTPAWTQWLILSGVVLVAIGITSSQYSLPAWIEVASVTILAGAALRFALSLFNTQGLLFKTGGLALAGGMTLALGYGWRYVYLIPALDIPTMYALHGSLNSLGFALPVVLAIYSTNPMVIKLTRAEG